MNRDIRAAAIMAALALAACGGGGGGGEAATSISASPALATLTLEEGQQTYLHPEIVITYVGDGVAAGFPADSTIPDWMTIVELSSGPGSASFALQVEAPNQIGTRQTTVRFLTGRVSSGGNVSQIKYVDVPFTYTVTASALSISGTPASMSFETYATGPVPAAQQADVSFSGGATSASVESAPYWLDVTEQDDGSIGVSPMTFDLRPNSSATSGVFSGNVVFAVQKAGSSVVRRHTLPVSYTVRPKLAAAGGLDSSRFVFGSSATTAGGTLSVAASTQSWTASSSAAWLTVSSAAQTGNAELPLQVDVAGLAIGNYSGTVTVTNTADGTEQASYTADVQVVAPTLTTSANSLLIGGSDGLATAGAGLTFNVDTGTHDWPWTLSLDAEPWGSVDAAAGTVAGSSIGVTIDADRDAVVGGRYAGSATLSVDVDGHVLTRTLAITFNKEAERLYVDSEGVALASLPSRQVLSRDIGVSSTLGRTDRAWTATSDQSWLSVTPSGTTGEALTVTADPAGLAADQTHFATVTLESDAIAIENAPTIRVGLYVGSADPSGVIASSGEQSHIAVSPVEPLIYANNGTDLISAYHVYTGAVVRSFAAGTTAPGRMTLSGDGQTLYVIDTVAKTVRVLNAVTGTLSRTYAYTTASSSAVVFPTYARPGAQPALLLGNDTMVDLASETVLTGGPGGDSEGYGTTAVTTDGRTAYFYNGTDSGGALIRYALKRTALATPALSAPHLGSVGTNNFGRDVAISRDGQHLYTTGGSVFGPGEIRDPVTLGLTGALAENGGRSIDVSWNGQVLGASYDPYGDLGSDASDMTLYTAGGAVIGSTRCSDVGSNSVITFSGRFSSDGLRISCLGGSGFSGALYLQDTPN